MRRDLDRAGIDAALGELQDEGLLSDARFAEQFVAERVGKGDGPVKIQAALTERGVSAAEAEAALAPYADEWLERARAAYRRRFGDEAPAGWHERARRARYLQQRGFPPEVVQRITAFADGGDPA